jgi:hypothetical protein
MKPFSFAVIILSAFYPLIARGAETANGRLWCLSLRFQQGNDSFGNTLDLSSINGTPNGELEPYQNLTYISGFNLDVSGLPILGTIFIDLPAFADVNGNGFNDFFESALAVGATTTGTYTSGLEGGTLTATWQRGAGSKDGSCTLHLVDSVFGDLGSFNHTFQLIEYQGPVLFTPGSNSVTGSVNLVQTGDATSQIEGPFQFMKLSTNRFNRLLLQPGAWTNAASQSLTFTNDLYYRDLPWTTNYYGLVEFDDGDPNSPDPDYLTWVLSIDDSNDSDHNGIPDFSDDPAIAPGPRVPALALVWNSTNLLFSVAGDIGHVHQIQQISDLSTSNWQIVVSVTLTNNPQILSIPFPTGSAAFWRVLAR